MALRAKAVVCLRISLRRRINQRGQGISLRHVLCFEARPTRDSDAKHRPATRRIDNDNIPSGAAGSSAHQPRTARSAGHVAGRAWYRAPPVAAQYACRQRHRPPAANFVPGRGIPKISAIHTRQRATWSDNMAGSRPSPAGASCRALQVGASIPGRDDRNWLKLSSCWQPNTPESGSVAIRWWRIYVKQMICP